MREVARKCQPTCSDAYTFETKKPRLYRNVYQKFKNLFLANINLKT